jgi:arginyl-tRNA synthetase
MQLLEHIERIANDERAGGPWAARPFPAPHARFDLSLMALSDAAKTSAAADAAVQRLQRAGLVSDAQTSRRGHVHLGLDDSVLQAQAGELGEGFAQGARDLLAGQRYAVHFCDPNATKALHVGHLRNIAAGASLASALRYAGADVETRSVVGDFNRNMTEAMASLWPIRRQLLDAGWTVAEKPDHWIGRRYAQYVARTVADGSQPAATAAQPLQREIKSNSDLADTLMQRLLRGDAAATQLWRVVRETVVDGQLQTLSRLGVSLDRVDYDSRLFDRARALARRGIGEGLFGRMDDGRSVYTPSRPDASSISVLRRDGTPTQYLVSVAYWDWYVVDPRLREVRGIRVMGDEWRPAVRCSEELLARLRPEALAPRFIVHGMVTLNGRSVKSSSGEPMLIDDLLEWLEAEARRAAATGDAAGDGDLSALAANVALGYFMGRALGQRMEFSLPNLRHEAESLGWLLARALCRRETRAPASASGDDAELRFAVMRASLFRRHVSDAAARSDVARLANYLAHLARWYLAGGRTAPVARVVRTVMREGHAALGLTSPHAH